MPLVGLLLLSPLLGFTQAPLSDTNTTYTDDKILSDKQ